MSDWFFKALVLLFVYRGHIELHTKILLTLMRNAISTQDKDNI